jgi:hypothetical protein
MNWSDLKDTAASVAPFLGTLIGGPAGGTVGKLIAGACGIEASPQKFAEALTDPSKLVEVRKYSMAHKERLEAIALETLKAELADKADARENHKDSPMPAIITLMMTLIVGALLMMLFTMELPESNREVAYMLFGQASALWAASVTYWVGTTRSSAQKTKLLQK